MFVFAIVLETRKTNLFNEDTPYTGMRSEKEKKKNGEKEEKKKKH